ncbi:hypothetical protein F9277_07340 [Vibrio harveyi]|nr:hypothetical protein [Vibrio owensii]QFQ77232.1 hypothetical protein F9277_07340 [Vibrio harveyi]
MSSHNVFLVRSDGAIIMRKQDKVSGQKSGLKVRALITEQSVSIQRKKRPQGGAFGQKSE